MANTNWKRRAEGMLSQFIEGSVNAGDVDMYYDAPTSSPPKLQKPFFPLENFSTTGPPPTCTDSVYDRLLGCTCRDDHAVDDGACGSLFLQWVKLALGRAVKAYLSNPILLALLPLALGAAIGYYFGTRNNNVKRKHSTLLGRLSELYQWACLHLILMSQSKSSCELFDEDRDERTRAELHAIETKRESGVPLECVPRHIAVIMDGNRRYGKEKYGSATRGHWDGSKTLIEFGKWCINEGIQTLTVYAFSTENWNRDAEEVSALMSIFCKYCDELRGEAIQRGMRIHVLTTEGERIPEDVRRGIERMEEETKHCTNFTMNICLSYGGRNEITNACRDIAADVQAGNLDVAEIGEATLQKKMLTNHCCDPDIIIRTSGEERLSNFLLWQAAYSEFFFLEKQWPELQKEDLLYVIRTFANGRKRRYGK